MVLLQSQEILAGSMTAPEFLLPGTDGKNYSLSDFYDKDGVVIIFTCNHCPYAKAAWPLLISIAKLYELRNIQFIAINSNDDKEHPDDSFEGMKTLVKELTIPFPYLRDGYQETAKAYKAVCIPDVYVFDQKRVLYYHGRINDRWEDQSKVTEHDLINALNGLLAGTPAPFKQHPSLGCSIKWKQ